MATDASSLDPLKTSVSTDILLFFKTPFTCLPASKPVDFDALIGGNLSTDARTVLKLATEQRKKLLEVLADPKVDVRNIIGAVDAYLPSIWRITASITASIQASSDASIKVNKAIEFKWKSSLNKKGKEFSGNVFLYELAFVLTIRAIYHRDASKILLEKDPHAFQDVGKELRTAAGIFEFAGRDLLSRWQSPPEHRAPEVLSEVHSCMAALYLADAQRVAIAKAISAPGINPTLIAKLLIGAAEKYEFATRCLQRVDKETFDSMIPGLLEELGAYPAILRGFAANCVAQAAWAKCEYSKGLAYAIDGARRLQVITMGKGLQSSPLQDHLTKAIARAVELEKEYHNDCTNVYFEKPLKELKPLDASFIINSIPYELPPVELVSFAEVPLPAGQAKMPIQSFWTSLWAKPQDYPSNNEEHRAAGNEVSGATALPGLPDETTCVEVPKGVDPSVFSALPDDIKKEITQDVARGGNVSL